MFKYESIAELIEKYLSKQNGKSKTLTALEVRKWKETDSFCQNTCYANVCRAMQAVQKYPYKIVGGAKDSSTFTVEYRLK